MVCAHIWYIRHICDLLRLADRSPLAQRRVLARARCIQANGHDARGDTVLQSSAATLLKSSAATAVRTEIASQRSSLLQTIGCHGCLMAGNNHTGTASCPGAARRAADAFAALLRLLQQHPAHRVRSAGSALIRELKEHRTFDCEELFSSGLHGEMQHLSAHLPSKVRIVLMASHRAQTPCSFRGPKFTLTPGPRKKYIYQSVDIMVSCCCSWKLPAIKIR